MALSTDNLTLTPDASVDLQLHTEMSDGKWTAATLIDHLQVEGFGLAAITDHDRADIAPELQAIAIEKGFPLLVAVEVSSFWKDNLVDFLCYGFDPLADNALLALSEDVAQRQRAMTTGIIETLRETGYTISDETLNGILAKPASQHVMALIDLASALVEDGVSVGKTLLDAGFAYVTVPPAEVVAAAHASDAICVLGHPGRDDGFTCFDAALLDELRTEAPIDGIEAYYPKHTPEQTQLYLQYAHDHDLLVSAGSDSHSIDNPPIQYKARDVRALLERLGVTVSAQL